MKKSANRKVLIISYYWPPAGGVAVQRWYKFAEYMNEFGYDPIIYTVENGEFTTKDDSLSDRSDEIEVLREPLFEPYKFYKKFTGKKKSDSVSQEVVGKNGKKENVAVWIRGNFFIPDARKYWVKRSVKRLSEYLSENKVDLIVSNGTPHSCHLIGLGLKNKFDLPWLADFRDPWTKVDYFDKLKLSESSQRKHEKLERKVLEQADVVTTVSPSWKDDFKELGAKKAFSITNGFDPKDFNDISSAPKDGFIITHLGSLSKHRFHLKFWETIHNEVKRNEAFEKLLKIRLIGNVDAEFIQYFKDSGLIEHVELIEHMSHQKALQKASESHVLMLLLGDKTKSKGRIPAKLFEYMPMIRPVLAYGQKESDVEAIVSEFSSWKFVPFDNFVCLKKSIQELFEEREQIINGQFTNPSIEKYERKYLCKEMTELFDSVVKITS
jgi:glycosyltransferase involved in cell wall biosynthesis